VLLMTNGRAFPTILVAEDHDLVMDSLVRDLQQEGYMVLVAHDGFEAIQIARFHSRPIHLMLTDDSEVGRFLAAELKQYRPKTHVVFITRDTRGNDPDFVKSDAAVAKVRRLVKPPGKSEARTAICASSAP
jgi:CheY-like chemotaxis protein